MWLYGMQSDTGEFHVTFAIFSTDWHYSCAVMICSIAEVIVSMQHSLLLSTAVLVRL